mmetsp:Transcript_6643/g.18540  ORF Transcript_6643/g.18540 Transcript_6643/m.18540 type:complete len:247 (-) Transcript_6643:855-1595(-)
MKPALRLGGGGSGELDRGGVSHGRVGFREGLLGGRGGLAGSAFSGGGGAHPGDGKLDAAILQLGEKGPGGLAGEEDRGVEGKGPDAGNPKAATHHFHALCLDTGDSTVPDAPVGARRGGLDAGLHHIQGVGDHPLKHPSAAACHEGGLRLVGIPSQLEALLLHVVIGEEVGRHLRHLPGDRGPSSKEPTPQQPMLPKKLPSTVEGSSVDRLPQLLRLLHRLYALSRAADDARGQACGGASKGVSCH